MVIGLLLCGQATLNVLPPSSNSLRGFQLNTKYIESQFHRLVLYIGVGTFLMFYMRSLKGHKVK
jgi:hypothetical protein